MKDILITGCTRFLKKELFENLGDEIRAMIADGSEVHADGSKLRI